MTVAMAGATTIRNGSGFDSATVPEARLASIPAVPESDEVLLARLRHRDEAALEALYDRYGRLALGLALRMVRDHDLAEDVVQESFLSVWRQAGSYDAGRGNAKTWLLSIVRHRCIDYLRRIRAAGPTEPIEATIEDGKLPSVFEAANLNVEREKIVAALQRLPTEQCQAISLAYFGGYTHVEIAAIQRVPLGTVKGRLRIGLQKLRALLAELGAVAGSL